MLPVYYSGIPTLNSHALHGLAYYTDQSDQEIMENRSGYTPFTSMRLQENVNLLYASYVLFTSLHNQLQCH